MGRYMDGVVALSVESERVRLTLLEVMNMLKPPHALFGPAIALEVLHKKLVGHVKDQTIPLGPNVEYPCGSRSLKNRSS